MNENNFMPQQNQQNQSNMQTQQSQQNNQQGQPQFQQQFQQNINPQQYQQYQRPSKPITETVIEFMPKLVLAFVILAGAFLAYDLILGIVKAASGSRYGEIFGGASSGFGIFLNYLVNGVESAAKYLFYAGVTTGIYKLIRK